MTERYRNSATSTTAYSTASGPPSGAKMENDLLSPRKTMLVLVIVVGCFAVLWPKVFYPMLLGSANQHLKPSPIDKTTGCCDVISDTDVNTIKIMSELCGTIIKSHDKPLSGKEIVQICKKEVLDTCGIDISAVLQEQVRLGQSVKQIIDEVRSLNGSLCLKHNFGVAPWKLGVPHRVTVKVTPGYSIRQERPLHLKTEMIHPAFRERGRAIPQPSGESSPSRPPPRVIEGRPGPIPGMRPTIGGAGHVVPPSKQGTSSMSIIMPIYTIGIVVFFTYTLMKILFKKQPEGVGGSLYPPIDPDPHFRREVFESEKSRLGPRLNRDISSKLVVNAMSALLDEVDQEIEARRKSSEVATQDLVNGTISNGDALKPQDTEEQPTVKVLGMEMTASCEGGKKWSRPDSPVLPAQPPPPTEPTPPPQEIYLEGALPAQSHLLVSESATEPQPTNGEDPAVVLAGKMTLSVISLDSSENGGDEAEINSQERNTREASPVDVEFASRVHSEEDVPVEEVAGEAIDNLIKEAIENIEQSEPVIAKFDNPQFQPSNLEESVKSLREQIEKLAAQESMYGTENDNLKLDDEPLKSDELNHDIEPTESGHEVAVKGLKTEILQDNLSKLVKEQFDDSNINSQIEPEEVAEETLIPKSADNIPVESGFTNFQPANIQEDLRKLEVDVIPVLESQERLQQLEEITDKVNIEPLNLQTADIVENVEPQPKKQIIEDVPNNSVPLQTEETLSRELPQTETTEASLVLDNSEIEKGACDSTDEIQTQISDHIETAKIIFSDGEDELGSDEEVVDEIEEITYESSSEGSQDEAEDESNAFDKRKANGEGSEDVAESKYSRSSPAENDISEDELSEDEDVEYEEEIIEIEDDEDADDENDLNHVSEPSEPENE